MKKQNPSNYHVYLLRCWHEGDADDVSPPWRFRLEGIYDSQHHVFANLEALLTFLQQITQSPPEEKHESNVHPTNRDLI